MEDLFKKFINTGVGFLSQSNKRIQAAIDQLVKDSKMSEQEGKKIMDELMKSGETKRKSLEKQFQSLTDSVRERVGLATDKATPASKPAAKKVSSPAAKAAGATKKAADSVSAAADKAKRSAAAKAGAAKKKAAAAGASEAK